MVMAFLIQVLVALSLDDRITLASAVLKEISIENRDHASAIMNHLFGLQNTSCFINPFTSNTQHVGHEFLG